MREIDRHNLNNNNKNLYKNYNKQINEIKSTDEKVNDSVETDKNIVQNKETNDLSAIPSTTFGKAMISTDNITTDMEYLMENPQQVAYLNKMFDSYIDNNHSYVQATQLLDSYRKEFGNAR